MSYITVHSCLSLPPWPPSSLPPPLAWGTAGACLGTGIERSKVGDILISGERGAQILVAPNLVEHLEQSLTQVWTMYHTQVQSVVGRGE